MGVTNFTIGGSKGYLKLLKLRKDELIVYIRSNSINEGSKYNYLIKLPFLIDKLPFSPFLYINLLAKLQNKNHQ